MTIRVLDPTQAAGILPATLARRQGVEKPVTLGLLSNGKTNAAKFLRLVTEQLTEQMRIERTINVEKESASTNAPETLLDQLAETCDEALIAIGD